MLRKLFGPKWDKVTGDGRELHNGELHDLYISLVIKSRRMRQTGQMAYVGGKDKCIQCFWWVNLKKTDSLQGLGVDGGIILK